MCGARGYRDAQRRAEGRVVGVEREGCVCECAAGLRGLDLMNVERARVERERVCAIQGVVETKLGRAAQLVCVEVRREIKNQVSDANTLSLTRSLTRSLVPW